MPQAQDMNLVRQFSIQKFLARQSVALSVRFPFEPLTKQMLRLNGIQLTFEEVSIISDRVRAKAPCNFLIFGLGNDSRYWSALNKGGNTAFVEDNRQWFEDVTASNSELTGYLVDYATVRTQWKDLLETPQRLEMSFPKEIENVQWDIVLIDGPNGYDDTNPGRMKSIFAATRLTLEGADVFVHDCHREVERVYCDRFLQPENFKREVGLLRHYQTNTSRAI